MKTMSDHVQDNPYSAMLNVIRSDADERSSPAWCLGVVTSVAPLTVQTGGILLSGNDLLVNYQLRANAEVVSFSEVSGTLPGSVDCDKGSMTALTVSGGTLTAQGLFGGVLTVGDQVAMLRSADADTFIVLCKVVGA